MKIAAGALLSIFLGIASAWAAPTPLALYQAGEFTEAEAAGIAQNDAQGLAIAARAVLADDMMRDKPCLDCLRHAEELARRAIAADPKQPEGHIYLAAAIGYQGRIVGDLVAQSRGYANQAKRELDAALEDDPNDFWALAAMGSWHIEIVRGAGTTLARWLFGARLETGKEYYDKAFAIAPTNLVIRYQYALELAAFDLETYQSEVVDQLTRASTLAPQSAYEAFAKSRARDLLQTLKRGDTTAAQRLVRHDQGYPD